jgi:hypothetical protein
MLAVRMPNPACDARSTALAKMHAMPTDTPTDLPDTNNPHRTFSDNENEKALQNRAFSDLFGSCRIGFWCQERHHND